jgi:hypothetical protein
MHIENYKNGDSVKVCYYVWQHSATENLQYWKFYIKIDGSIL